MTTVANYASMSESIWPIVTENLAEQIASTQAGQLHPVQLMPFLPLSLEQIEKTLDDMIIEGRISKERLDGLVCYTFAEYLDRPLTPFKPTRGVYSDDPLDESEHTAFSDEVRNKIEIELGVLSENDPWPNEAVWQHELIYLIGNLPEPAQLSAIAGHSRLPFRKVDEKIKTLQKLGAVRFDLETATYSLPPMEYPKIAHRRHDAFIRRFPGARKEEDEIRLIKGLFGSFVILAICCLLAITAKLPFPLLFAGGLIGAVINFIRIFKAPPKPLPEI